MHFDSMTALALNTPRACFFCFCLYANSVTSPCHGRRPRRRHLERRQRRRRLEPELPPADVRTVDLVQRALHPSVELLPARRGAVRHLARLAVPAKPLPLECVAGGGAGVGRALDRAKDAGLGSGGVGVRDDAVDEVAVERRALRTVGDGGDVGRVSVVDAPFHIVEGQGDQGGEVFGNVHGVCGDEPAGTGIVLNRNMEHG